MLFYSHSGYVEDKIEMVYTGLSHSARYAMLQVNSGKKEIRHAKYVQSSV